MDRTGNKPYMSQQALDGARDGSNISRRDMLIGSAAALLATAVSLPASAKSTTSSPRGSHHSGEVSMIRSQRRMESRFITRIGDRVNRSCFPTAGL